MSQVVLSRKAASAAPMRAPVHLPHRTSRSSRRRRLRGTLGARVIIGIIAVLAASALLLAFPQIASAHAEPVSSTPAPDATLKSAPDQVTIMFSQSVDPGKSDIVVYSSANTKVSTGPATLVNGDLKKMSVPMKGTDAKDEEYLVVWHTASADDGETAIGAFSFAVSETASDATPTPSGGGTTGGSSSGANGFVVALVGVLGLALGGAGGYLFARRRIDGPAGGAAPVA